MGGGLDFTHSPPPINGPTPSHSPTTFDFEASVAARDDAVATYNNPYTTHTSMTHEPTTTTTTTPDATEGVPTTGTSAVAAPVIVMAEVVELTSMPSSSTTATNVHRTETVAVAVAVAVPVTEITE